MKNQMNIPKLLALAGTFICSAGVASAGYFGQFGYGLEISANGTSTFYGLNAWPTAPLLPTGSTATLDNTSWANGSEAVPVLNLGSFNPSAGNTLILKGGSELLYADVGSGGYASGGYINYRVFSGTGPAAVAGAPGFAPGQFMAVDVSLGGNDTRVAVQGLNIDLLAGLTPGTYTLGSYGFGYGNSDAVSGAATYANNGGANYGAYFTVVPEPACATLLGLGCLAIILRRRQV